MVSNLAIGLVGVGGRGGQYAAAIVDHDPARVHAVCDADAGALAAARDALDAEAASEDYGTKLSQSPLDAVVFGTPMPLLAPKAVDALERDVHVLSEVPVAGSITAVARSSRPRPIPGRPTLWPWLVLDPAIALEVLLDDRRLVERVEGLVDIQPLLVGGTFDFLCQFGLVRDSGTPVAAFDELVGA